MVISKRKHVIPGPRGPARQQAWPPPKLILSTWVILSGHYIEVPSDLKDCFKVRRKDWKSTHQSLPLELGDPSSTWHTSPLSRGSFISSTKNGKNSLSSHQGNKQFSF